MHSEDLLVNPQDIVESIERLVKETSKFLLLVCPYWDFGERHDYYRKIRYSVRRKLNKGIHVVCVYRKNDNICKRDILSYFGYKEWPDNLQILYNVRPLHSKFYMNESDIIISSMNLLESSYNNCELGIYVQHYDFTPRLKAKLKQHILEIANGYEIDPIILNHLD